MLNYAYTVLKSEVRIKAIADGYDPTIGVMHQGRDARIIEIRIRPDGAGATQG